MLLEKALNQNCTEIKDESVKFTDATVSICKRDNSEDVLYITVGDNVYAVVAKDAGKLSLLELPKRN